MKKILIALPVFIMLTAFIARQKKQRIVFFGDSITEAGVKPNGFITLIGNMLKQKGIDSNYELVGAGIGGKQNIRSLPSDG